MVTRLLAMFALFAVALAPFALAQTGERGEQAEALEQALRQRAIARQRADLFEEEAQEAANEAARFAARKAAAAARVQAAEADLTAAQRRIGLIDEMQRTQRARLAERQGSIIALTAALQTMARRPPALALVQQSSIRNLVHVRSLFETTLPIVRGRTAELRAEVVRGANLRLEADRAAAAIDERQSLLAESRDQLAALERVSRTRSADLARAAAAEEDRALLLGAEAADLQMLIEEFDRQASVRDGLIELPGPRLRPARPGEAAAPERRRSAQRSSRPPYRLPVMGELVEGLGEISDTGVRSRGLTIATQPGAQVIAPTAGRVSYAGPFRGYGRIVIIDHSGGWTTLITDLATLDVRVGDIVRQGAPIGRTRAREPRVTVELRREGEPVDISTLVSRG